MTEKEVGFALLTVSEVSGHSKEDHALWWPGSRRENACVGWLPLFSAGLLWRLLDYGIMPPTFGGCGLLS